MPGGGSPRAKALPDTRCQSQAKTPAITQGQLQHSAEPPARNAERRRCAAQLPAENVDGVQRNPLTINLNHTM